MNDLFPTVCECCGQPLPEKQGSPFSAFWAKWPNRKGKPDAEKAWKQLNPAQKAHAIESCARWFAAWRKEYPAASPILPASYLRRHVDDGVESGNVQTADWPAIWADKIKAGQYVPQTALTPRIVKEMVGRKLVDASKFRELGITV